MHEGPDLLQRHPTQLVPRLNHTLRILYLRLIERLLDYYMSKAILFLIHSQWRADLATLQPAHHLFDYFEALLSPDERLNDLLPLLSTVQYN